MEPIKPLPTLPGCLADRLFEAISMARDSAENDGSIGRIRKWEATAADLRAALAAQPGAVPTTEAALVVSAQAPVVVPEVLRDEIVKHTCWKHCMSYNDSYFGEPAGLVKRVAYQLDRILAGAQLPQQEAHTEAVDPALARDCAVCAGTRVTFGKRCACATLGGVAP